ncbi:MAG TPA: hypothetical protein VFY05_05175, partial [Candidatus Angelobacter sp.]|nr:hypothetical protein [Candidatus Angelobacter sp.]
TLLLALLLVGARAVTPQSFATNTPDSWQEPSLRLVYQFPTPVLTINSLGAEGNKYGFEGGTVLKLGQTYNLFTSEMVGDPRWVKMKLGYWTSRDRIHWKRVRTLFTSSGDHTGRDPRAALWAPMPVYNRREERWDLFYVAYRSKPDTKTEWFGNYDGTIWRAVSEVKGRTGIGGPYRDAGIILQPSKESEPWEGLQGTDSFFPYPVGNLWYGFYGSAQTQYKPIRAWRVGLARAPQLAGPWKRCPKLNPSPIETHFIENPVVTKLKDGTFVAVYDDEIPNAIGYAFSRDGIHWMHGKVLIVQPKGNSSWANHVRTPLGLIPERHHVFTLFYTGYQKIERRSLPQQTVAAGSLGWVTVSIAGRWTPAVRRGSNLQPQLPTGPPPARQGTRISIPK